MFQQLELSVCLLKSPCLGWQTLWTFFHPLMTNHPHQYKSSSKDDNIYRLSVQKQLNFKFEFNTSSDIRFPMHMKIYQQNNIAWNVIFSHYEIHESEFTNAMVKAILMKSCKITNFHNHIRIKRRRYNTEKTYRAIKCLGIFSETLQSQYTCFFIFINIYHKVNHKEIGKNKTHPALQVLVRI